MARFAKSSPASSPYLINSWCYVVFVVLVRIIMETSPPHYMQPHVTLSYPRAEVRRDLHRLLVHAVSCSTNPNLEKAKMYK